MTAVDILIGLALGTAALLFLRGWRYRSFPSQNNLLPEPWRIATFVIASLLLIITLFSPLQTLATHYFSLHVLQRLMLVSLIPLIFLSGNPLPILLAGLPRALLERVKQFPQSAPKLYSFLVLSLRPLPVWVLFTATFWLWHDVQLNRLVLNADWLHRLESLTLLGTAVLYWWHILVTSPQLHAPMPLLWRVGYAGLGATPIKLVGLVLLFSGTAVYQYPAEIQLNNTTLNITDQSLGAGLIWIIGGIVFTWTAVLLMRGWLKDEDEKPNLPVGAWSTEDMMLAPGFKQSSAYSPPSK